MKAVRVYQFGGLEAIVHERVSRPAPGEGQILVRVKAAGVGPWDAWVRAGQSVLSQPLPLVLGSDLSGVVEDVGPGVSAFHPGDAVFGVTNSQFTGAYAEYAVADAAMIAHKPMRLSYVEAASVPVVASTAWQMVFDHGHVEGTTLVLVHGAAGNVGAYAVQLAKRAGAEVIATAFTRDVDYVRTLRADHVIDVQTARFEARAKDVDVVIDTIGGETLDRSFAVLKPGGVLVSSVAMPDQDKATRRRVRGVFLLVTVTSEGLTKIAELLDAGHLTTHVGEVLPLAEARLAHEMLAGKPHKRGKIVLTVDA
jgi:NADPH:quinone reductase-like Zn-dependent oxidoreductase